MIIRTLRVPTTNLTKVDALIRFVFDDVTLKMIMAFNIQKNKGRSSYQLPFGYGQAGLQTGILQCFFGFFQPGKHLMFP